MNSNESNKMTSDKYIENLTKLGLTNGEARVYLSMIQIGPSKVGKIVELSRVSYSKIYGVLDRLISKGLASYSIQNNIKYFQSLEPTRLNDYVEKKEDELKEQKRQVTEIINNLTKTVYASKRSTSEIFIGEKSLRLVYTILLSNSKKGDVLRYFYPYADAHEKATPFYYRFYKYQKSKRIVERGLVTLDFKNSKHFKEIPNDVKLRHVDFPLPVTIDIFCG